MRRLGCTSRLRPTSRRSYRLTSFSQKTPQFFPESWATAGLNSALPMEGRKLKGITVAFEGRPAMCRCECVLRRIRSVAVLDQTIWQKQDLEA